MTRSARRVHFFQIKKSIRRPAAASESPSRRRPSLAPRHARAMCGVGTSPEGHAAAAAAAASPSPSAAAALSP